MRILAIITVAVLFAGCSRTTEMEKAEEKKAQAPSKSTARQVVDGVTGKSAVEAGKQARKTIERVSAQKDQNLDEILGE